MILLLLQAGQKLSTVDSALETLTSPETYVKLGILAVLAPFWWPVLKAMHHELQGALRKEGGLFGRKPTVRELGLIEARDGVYENPLVNVPHGTRVQRRAASSGRTAGAGAGKRSPVKRTHARGF